MPDRTEKLLPLALYPLIATQGLYVKFRAAQLCEAAGPREGVVGRGRPLRVLIVGDSSAAGVGVAHQSEGLAGHFTDHLKDSHEVRWKLVARCGDTTAHSLRRLEEVPAEPYDVALTALGVNDAKNGVPLALWQKRTDALHDMLVNRFGARLVIASGLPPVQDFPLLPDPLRPVLARRCQQFDAALQEVVATRGQVRHLRGDIRLTPQLMAEDGFHPKGEVYREWARRAAQIVAQNPVVAPH